VTELALAARSGPRSDGRDCRVRLVPDWNQADPIRDHQRRTVFRRHMGYEALRNPAISRVGRVSGAIQR